MVLVALIAFLVAGRVQSHNASSPSLITPNSSVRPGANASPFGGSTATTPVPSDNGLSATDISSIASKITPAVVDITTRLGFDNAEAAGTGMVLTSSGEVLTNNHVIQGATEITATLVNTGKSYKAHVVGTDPTDDVAVIQLEGASKLTTFTASKTRPELGDAVVATGNAGGRGGAPSVVSGTVVAVGQTITVSDDNGGNPETLTDHIQVTAALEAGDSGGPLVNTSGQVIGMDTAAEVSGARFRSTSTAGYAIPIDKALTIAGQIESGQASSTVHIGLPAFLGVDLTPARGRSQAGAGTTAGAVISGVESGTPADSIGLAAGDTITSVDGQAVTSASTLTSLLQSHKPGDKVSIGWTDSGGTHHSEVATLTTGPAD
jgi:S1-C subfamily serine protease